MRGRTALVTGAGTGIGRAVALRLVELGADVVGVGRRPERLAETARLAGERFEATPLDVRDRAAAAAFVAGLGRLDLLVNNAGGQFVAPAAGISRRGFDAVADLNLTALAALLQAARAGLTTAGGRVVNLSLSAPDRGIAGLAHSAAARAGIAALTRSLAREWPGVRLFCLAPGTVLTAGVGDELPPEVLARIVATTPLGRDTSLAEVAEWVAALGSGVADAVSGALIELDGGSGLVSAASLTG
ncbi:SDR family NAD(P)-dependent oxidoreductase [Actinophytocola algeriensis]|uniref:Peroxisomal trans-2-enoyl-CoA reductase n=1 Tax=Actinophytocola algeriensis TaxID=1768010 RepID=A0A7W7VIB6_9PSEU|nr:SDR family oxidoreductase [Actinophytocola algeriensis]MBB4910905.1 citronellol/citronellal dehydrogenase [Actinophytocola algeriensis]MBE1473898.1 citronellol/citronellal dehydrogenase [Actinophytocola algeriensis]